MTGAVFNDSRTIDHITLLLGVGKSDLDTQQRRLGDVEHWPLRSCRKAGRLGSSATAPRTVADHERSVPAVGMSLLLLSLSSDSGLVVLTNTGATT